MKPDWRAEIENIIYEEVEHMMGSNGNAFQRLQELFESLLEEQRSGFREELETMYYEHPSGWLEGYEEARAQVLELLKEQDETTRHLRVTRTSQET